MAHLPRGCREEKRKMPPIGFKEVQTDPIAVEIQYVEATGAEEEGPEETGQGGVVEAPAKKLKKRKKPRDLGGFTGMVLETQAGRAKSKAWVLKCLGQVRCAKQ